MDPVQSYYQTPELARARTEASTSQQESDVYSAQSTALPDLLREALAKKFSTNNPLYAQRESALTNFMRESEAAPLSVTPEANQGMVFNPQEQAAMIAGRRGAALAPITSLNEMLGTAYGGLDNIIAAATRSYQAIAGVKGAKAKAARQNLEDLLDIASKQQQQAQQQQEQSNWERQFGESIRQFNVQEGRLGKTQGISEAKETKKRKQQATDEFVADMQADVQEALLANPNADPKQLTWQWINANEPYFGAAGVDTAALWDIYKRTPSKSTGKNEGFNPIKGIGEFFGGLRNK